MLKELARLLFPEECRVCGRALHEGERHVCEPCLAGLGRTLYWKVPMNEMEQRFAGLQKIERASAWLYYGRNSPAAQLIQDFKYRHMPSLATYLGSRAAHELLLSGFFSDVDFFMPVPVHFLKRMRRGYNQTEYICEGLSRETGVPVSLDLRARRGHATQTHKTLEERRRNTQGVYRLRHGSLYAGRHVMLVDDVCTTGSTLVAAAQAVAEEAPGVRISLFTLAVTNR